ncbi:porin family protein [Vibrio sp. RE86]|uniref:outer membrane beta-barrel protein n=1 Tax=Vibrio sp. RE86 TaxID=2607605 RepID=UPI001493781D|nr:outer membrane beta-barrel protein [Vibrio sp. RE86]NOH79394.1 porin family protein [Vibrio sp. RE86]
MKKSLGLIVLTSLCSPAYAVDFFLGGGGSYQSMKGEIADSELGSYSDNAQGGAFHLRGGLYIDNTHRLTATINHMTDSSLYRNRLNQEPEDISTGIDLSQTEYLISYDYLYAVSSTVSLFGGATAGLVNNRVEANFYDRSNGDNASHKGSQTDFTYGLQAGLQYKIMNNLSADLQYRHMFESYSETINWETGDSTTLSVPYNNQISFSIDYRF